jgi:hypothetical protein
MNLLAHDDLSWFEFSRQGDLPRTRILNNAARSVGLIVVKCRQRPIDRAQRAKIPGSSAATIVTECTAEADASRTRLPTGVNRG